MTVLEEKKWPPIWTISGDIYYFLFLAHKKPALQRKMFMQRSMQLHSAFDEPHVEGIRHIDDPEGALEGR